ncbi:MAG TPA: NCS1 family nucleobase:cation symporter-1 [Vicinamibacterales bacterium]|nr:NCS1 family nucleobase:cation symporter-1 [Vicinamibacterales bacterium]
MTTLDEAKDLSAIESSARYNADLAPVPPGHRTWGTYDIAALWIGMAVCIPTYMLAAGLVAGGMSWAQAVFTIALGNAIVLIPMMLTGHAGTKYGIPFPVLARSAFGLAGSHVPALLRAGVACGWFGIQAWIGGAALNTLLGIALPFWTTIPAHPWIAFGLFWALNIYFIVRGTESIRFFEKWAAPVLLLMGFALLAWAIGRVGGLGPIFSQPSRFQTPGEFWAFFVPSLTGMIGYWATLSISIPDFTRYATSQRAQIAGQAIGLPPTMALFSFIGVAVASASVLIFGEAIWDPVALLGRFDSPFVILLSVFALAVATLTTNIAANVVPPANAFANLLPRKISFRTGGLITGFIGIAMMPWKLLSDFQAYIFGWLVGYSGLLGPVAGILIVDYWIIRRRTLNVRDLYVEAGEYPLVNWPAMVALAAGIGLALVGLVVPPLRPLYDYAWFVGFFVSGALHAALARR